MGEPRFGNQPRSEITSLVLIEDDSKMADVTRRTVNTSAKIDIFSVMGGVLRLVNTSRNQKYRGTNLTSPDDREYSMLDCI